MSPSSDKPVQVVWFKRDLRVEDHAPLWHAAKAGLVWPIYIAEPAYWQLPDTSLRHQAFIQECLVDLDRALRARGAGLSVMSGDAVDVMGALKEHFGALVIHAHEETGNDWTFQRDRRVRHWAKQQGVELIEYPQFGVIRGLKNRDHWASQWAQYMKQTLYAAPTRLTSPQTIVPMRSPFESCPCADNTPTQSRQPGGLVVGEGVLSDFLSKRGLYYRGGISSPNSAPTAASRLSAHIAYGSLSLRAIVQATWNRQAEARSLGLTRWSRSLAQFERRLHWHCHFIQKLEQQPRLEYENMHRGFDGMREEDFNETFFEAWKEGQTGYPLIDACMRSLKATGWLTFRMRAMVTSFSSYHLWLHWQKPAWHLARLFTDYEPGIHYNQIQMQSGTTGINATRIYNPVKQAQDQDPDGVFVSRWVPELAQGQYINPIVDHQEAQRLARQRMKVFRDQVGFRDQSRAIYQALGSRNRPTQRKKKVAQDKRQTQLFD